MIAVTRTVGIILVILGVAAYALTGADSVTALLPAVLGLPILLLALLAAAKPNLHRPAIHAALALALLGFLGTLMNVAEVPALLTGGDVERPVAVLTSTATAAICLAYVVLGVRSFRAARRQPSGV